MKKEEITGKVIFEGLKEAKGEMFSSEDFVELIKDELQNQLESAKENLQYDEDDEDFQEQIEKVQNALEEIKEIDCDDAESAFAIYEYVDDEDFYVKEKYEELEDDNSSYLISEYLKIIANLPDCDYDISFSAKSASIYLFAKVPDELDADDFSDCQESFCIDCENGYTDDEQDFVEIRLSDHNFGGAYTNSGFYRSYEKECINYVVRA